MPERDIFAEIIADHGPPQHAVPVTAEDAKRYDGRVPGALIDFWLKYGRGDYRDGYDWICDPAPFDPILATIFDKDPEFAAQDMTLIAYTAYSYATVWNCRGHTMHLDFENSTVNSQPPKALVDPATRKPFSKDFLVGWSLAGAFLDDVEWFEMACDKRGRLQRGEVFAYAPLLQLGGTEDLDHIHRVEVTVHMDMVAQLEPFTLIELTDPEPGAPLGRLRPVRRIGPTR